MARRLLRLEQLIVRRWRRSARRLRSRHRGDQQQQCDQTSHGGAHDHLRLLSWLWVCATVSSDERSITSGIKREILGV